MGGFRGFALYCTLQYVQYIHTYYEVTKIIAPPIAVVVMNSVAILLSLNNGIHTLAMLEICRVLVLPVK